MKRDWGSTYTRGTAIAAIANSEQCVIAADSRTVNDLGQPIENKCKIHIVNGVVLAGHGMASHQGTGYDLLALASAVAVKGASITSIATELAHSGKLALEEVFAYMLANQPAIQESAAATTPGVVIARWEDKRPAMCWIQFNPDLNQRPISVISEVHNNGPGKSAGTFVCPVLAEEREFRTRHPEWWLGNTVATARLFIDEQIEKRRPSVGPPIDIVLLRDGLIEWIDGPSTPAD